MEKLAPQAWELELLEEEVRVKIGRITAGCLFHRRFIKAGSFRKNPITVHSLPWEKKSHKYLPAPDRLAHSFTNPDFNYKKAASGIGRILLIPEIVRSEQYLMTHLYDAADRTLVFYLYPSRLNQPFYLPYNDRLEERTLGAGLEDEILNQIEEILCDPEPFGPAQKAVLHKFIVPVSLISSAEIQEMESLHESYGSLVKYEF